MLGFDYRGLGQHYEAKECDEKALTIAKTTSGEEHCYVERMYRNLAFDYRNLEENHAARECNEKALIIGEKIHGDEHPEIIKTCNNLAIRLQRNWIAQRSPRI